MIAEMKEDSQKSHLHSFYVLDEIKQGVANEADNEASDSSDDRRLIAEELNQNLEESFLKILIQLFSDEQMKTKVRTEQSRST